MSNPYNGAILGYNTTLGYSGVDSNDLPSGGFTVIASLIDTKPPTRKVAKADGTNYTSPGSAEEYNPSLIAVDEGTFKLFYKYATAAILEGLIRVTKAWQITYPDGHTFTWVGWLSELGDSIPCKENIIQECKIQPISANSAVRS